MSAAAVGMIFINNSMGYPTKTTQVTCEEQTLLDFVKFVSSEIVCNVTCMHQCSRLLGRQTYTQTDRQTCMHTHRRKRRHRQCH